jgi:Protein of unknown function, DUF547
MGSMKSILCLLIAFFGIGYADTFDTLNTFDSLLKTYVSEDGFVDYDAWKANESDLAKLQAFIDEMAAYDPGGLSGSEQLAFWINAYNALALHEVLERYPVDTIRPAPFLIPERSFFVEAEHVVGGKNYNLDQIENDIIRKLGEPRIHFAINCASLSCPKLRNEAYNAQKLEDQLNLQAIAFINDSVRNQFDVANNTARLSKIFDWFKKDFDSVGGVASYLSKFAQGDAKKLLQSESLVIRYLDYDWSLNKQR